MDLFKSKKPLLTRYELFIVIIFFCFVFIILLFTFFTPNYYKQNSPVEIDIRHGETLSSILDTLYAKEIIPNKMNMKIISYIYGADRKIKAGRYKIPNGLSYLKLIDLLTNGMTAHQILVTIPEGIWQTEIAQILRKELSVDSSKVMELSKSKSFIHSLDLNIDNLEGYLLPESYYFYPTDNVEAILRKLKMQMDKLFTPEVEARMKYLKMKKNDVLTIASIVDGESNYVPEFKTIAGVYFNRLKKGMPLQADPTIQFLIRDQRKNRVLYKDLQINSRYNTYKYLGLPPGPINNPGKDAIMAVLFPEQHNYLYFVSNGNGRHVFSKTVDEHEQNVIQYRTWRKHQK
jgi:UPF0755 protein